MLDFHDMTNNYSDIDRVMPLFRMHANLYIKEKQTKYNFFREKYLAKKSL